MAAELGRLLVLARRKGSQWYLAAISASEHRTLTLDLSFLGSAQLKILADGPVADAQARDYVAQTRTVANGKLTVELARNGGWVARTSPIEAVPGSNNSARNFVP